MTVDLEKARASDEALPYPLDAKEIWVSGKGQMHINPPNEPSIFFTLSDLCEFRNLFHGQAAEIERLRAELASANVELLAAGELVTRLKRVREAEIDQAGAAERMYLEGVRLKDARIQELEDALAEERARGNHYGMEYEDAVGDGKFERWIIDGEKDSPKFYLDRVRSEARRQLQAEGKIGPEDAKPRSWRITDERIRAIQWAEEMAGDCKAGDVLQAMLEEAGQ